MKIISGKYKGRVLKGFSVDGTRPTMDRVKESVFAMIQDYIKDSIVLDLYSGSGNLAIEAISNGAKYAYLVDNSKDAIKMIKCNISMLNINNAIVIEDNSKKAVNKLIDNGVSFNIVFLDPPYLTNELDSILKILNENYNKLNKDILIICETTLNIDYNIYKNFKIYKEKKYGNKIVTILKIV